MKRLVAYMSRLFLCLVGALCLAVGMKVQNEQVVMRADLYFSTEVSVSASQGSRLSIAAHPMTDLCTRAEELSFGGANAKGRQMPVSRLNPYARLMSGGAFEPVAETIVAPLTHTRIQNWAAGEYAARMREAGYYVYSLRKIII